MVTISSKAYRFLLDSYEDVVETFYDDPFDYADGDPLKQVFDELKELGDEFEIDVLSLAKDDDLERLKKAMEKEENESVWSQEEERSEKFEMPETYRHTCVDDHIPIESHMTQTEGNKSIEERLRELSNRNQSDEMIGEWTTYEIEEEK